MAKTVLQQMVQETLLMQYAKNNNISVSDAEIDTRENQLKANFPSGAWDEMLKARGLTEADVRNALREQIILDKALAKDVTISPTAIKQYFDKNRATFDKPEQVTARHILVPNLAEAQKVEADLKGGQSFATLAKKYSTDPGSKDKGGELGSFRKGQMVPAFDKYAFSAPLNQISPPIKSPFGYHIIQVESRTPGQKATLASCDAADHRPPAPAAGSAVDPAVPRGPSAEGEHHGQRPAVPGTLQQHSSAGAATQGIRGRTGRRRKRAGRKPERRCVTLSVAAATPTERAATAALSLFPPALRQ